MNTKRSLNKDQKARRQQLRKRNVRIELDDGHIVDAKNFATRQAAESYAVKHDLSIVFFRAHNYYVA